MEISLRFFLTLLWFGYMIAGGVHLFSKGFLLSKIVQDDRAMCTVLRNESNSGEQFNTTRNYCLDKQSKVIVLLVDALKYDFGVYNASVEEGKAAPFQNNLKVIHELQKSAPSHTRLYKFIADPPTTTLQRLKGLTTGTLPTFIDMGSNFATPEINEDNIIDQLKANGKRSVFMGDSTWTDLFPKRFNREYSYPSFNIFDLDSIDREIERILPKELPAKDWDLLVAHSLGVDHCGHKHGPYHAEMKRKLTEVDQMIRGIISQMQDNTVLFVIGDHGMTDTGDHGGESEAETNALLFAYSKGYPFLELRETPVEDSMQQIDFVPVLASILGVPVPFSNLGTINVNLLPDAPFRDWTKHQVVLQSVWQNARQVQSYFESYAQDNEATFEEDVIESLENKFLTLSYRVSSIYSDSAFQNFEKDLRTHLRSILTICRDVWVRFDPLGMQQGLLIVIFAVILQFLLVSNLNAKQLDAVFNTKTIQMIYLLNVGAAVFVFFGNSASTAAFLSGKFNVVLVTCLLSVVILAFVLVQSWLEVVERWSENRSVTNMLTRCLYGGFVCVFFSNSFVVQEQKIVTYLLAGIVCCSAWKLQRHFNYKQGHKWSHRMVYLTILSLVSYALFLLRLAHLYFKCREEQGDCMGAGGEDVTEVLGMAKYISRYLKLGSLCDKIDVTSIVSMALFVTVCRLFLQSCGAFMGYSLKGILNKFGPSAMAICVGAHFVLANNKVAASYPIQVDSMAWVVYVMFLVQVVVCVTRPLMTYLVDRRSKTEVQSSQVIPEIFNKLRNLYQKSEQPHIPIVYGLPTMYSTALVAFLVFLVLLLSLLLGANAANGLFMALAVAATVVFLQSVVHYNSTDSLEALMNPKFFTLVSWAVLIQFTFYVTSHQPTLSQIDWRAAFVGRTFYQDNSNVVSGVLVLSNIFCGVILFGLMFPMLIIGPFLIYVKYPEFKEVFRKRVQNSEQRRQMGAKRTSAKGEEEQSTDYKIESLSQNNEDAEVEQEATGFDVTRGELNLYENERCLLVTGFRVASKLLLLQGFRTFCSMLACTIHCRHLMVWKIFAPRFIFEGIATFIYVPVLLGGFVLLARVHRAVVRLIHDLTRPQGEVVEEEEGEKGDVPATEKKKKVK